MASDSPKQQMRSQLVIILLQAASKRAANVTPISWCSCPCVISSPKVWARPRVLLLLSGIQQKHLGCYTSDEVTKKTLLPCLLWWKSAAVLWQAHMAIFWGWPWPTASKGLKPSVQQSRRNRILQQPHERPWKWSLLSPARRWLQPCQRSRDPAELHPDSWPTETMRENVSSCLIWGQFFLLW